MRRDTANGYCLSLIDYGVYAFISKLEKLDFRWGAVSCYLRQGLASNLHFRQFNGSKTRIVDKIGMRNLWVLIELAASNWFQWRQRIRASHMSVVVTVPLFVVIRLDAHRRA